ncbi:dicarboxylate/amino acid:cation symporter [Aquimonas sp.]|jgi:Na+/H+-dicarboxylate symporter|uniref:dicarboxylate/amino acid:cation symporter n=1 Tax=Aquimonas sp. TaxID=1872588 RepID=UPI0037C0C1F9
MLPYRSLTFWILIALVLGMGVGYVVNQTVADPSEVVSALGLVTTIFLRLIKMIIAPLVLATLVVGIAKMGDGAAVGRVGIKAVSWFLLASAVSLSLGLLMVNLLAPGVGLEVPLPEAGAPTGISATAMSLQDFVTHLVPTSIFDGLARNEILQIVVFSVLFGAACAAIGEKGKALVDAMEGLSYAMLKLTMYVMWFAPLAVFAAVASTVAKSGFGIIWVYGEFMLGFYVSIALLWLLLFGAAFLVIGRRAGRLFGMVREPVMLAFATASSEAAYPKTLAQLEKFGCSNRVASFVLPLGYSFNLDGSMMYCTFAVMFIAQAYGIELSWAQQLTMLLILMVTSKGMAGVPRASLVVIAATLAQFDLPEAGLLLLLGIDHFLDMGRSATNVIGNSVATALVSKWEGQLREEGDAPPELMAATAEPGDPPVAPA